MMIDKRIRIYPDPVLRKVAEEVDTVDGYIRDVISSMFEVMIDNNGIGLAAPQIGISKRVIVVSIDVKGFDRFALINPVIEELSDKFSSMEEGCLSIPGIGADVKRPYGIVVSGITKSGRRIRLEAEGLLARVIQHEIDHLNGVLFIDKLSQKERRRISGDLDNLASSSHVKY